MRFDQARITHLYSNIKACNEVFNMDVQACLDVKISAEEFEVRFLQKIEGITVSYQGGYLVEAKIIHTFLKAFKINIQDAFNQVRMFVLSGPAISNESVLLLHALQKCQDITNDLHQKIDKYIQDKSDVAQNILQKIIERHSADSASCLNVFQDGSKAIEALEDTMILLTQKTFFTFEKLVNFILNFSPKNSQDTEKLLVIIDKIIVLLSFQNGSSFEQDLTQNIQFVLVQERLKTKQYSLQQPNQTSNAQQLKEIANYLAVFQNPILCKRLSNAVIQAVTQGYLTALNQTLTAEWKNLVQNKQENENWVTQQTITLKNSYPAYFDPNIAIFIANLQHNSVPFRERTNLEDAYKALQETERQLKKYATKGPVYSAYIKALRNATIPLHEEVLACYQESQSTKAEFIGNMNKSNHLYFEETTITDDGNCAVNALNDSCNQDISRNDIADYLNVIISQSSVRECLKIYILEAWESGVFEIGKETWKEFKLQQTQQQIQCDSLYRSLKETHSDYQTAGEEPIKHLIAFLEAKNVSSSEAVDLKKTYQLLHETEEKINAHATCIKTCENYALALRKPGFWIDMQVLSLYAEACKIKLHIWQKSSDSVLSIRHTNKPMHTSQVVHLLFINGNHFNRLTVKKNPTPPSSLTSSSSDLSSVTNNASTLYGRPKRKIIENIRYSDYQVEDSPRSTFQKCG